MVRLEALDPETEKFLAQFKPRTTRSYRNRIKAFTKDTGITDVLGWIQKTDVHELKTYLQTYYNEQISKKAKINSVLATVTALRSIATEFGKTIKFRKGALDKVEEDQNSYEIASSDLSKLFDFADSTEKTILATATSLGYEISSFLALKRQKVKALIDKAASENEEWAFWVDNRSKTSAKRLNVLNPLAIKYLKAYIANDTKGWSEKLFPYAEIGLNAMLKRLFKKANINVGGQKIRFHSIRKWLMTKLNEAGVGQFSVKLILGKEIGVSDSTYLQHLEQTAFQDYKKVYEQYLAFTNGRTNGLKKEVEESRQDVESLKNSVKLLSQDNEKLKQDIQEIYAFVHENYDTLLEDLEDPDVYEAHRKARAHRLEREHEKEQVEAYEDEQKAIDETSKQLEKEGFFKKTDNEAKRLKAAKTQK